MASVTNGNGEKTKLEFERRDKLMIAGFVLGILGAALVPAAALAMYVFQPRTKAVVEHAAMEQTAALQAQETALRREFNESKVRAVEKDAADTKVIVHTIHANQRAFMHDMGARKAKRIPASVDVDFGELGLEDPE